MAVYTVPVAQNDVVPSFDKYFPDCPVVLGNVTLPNATQLNVLPFVVKKFPLWPDSVGITGTLVHDKLPAPSVLNTAPSVPPVILILALLPKLTFAPVNDEFPDTFNWVNVPTDVKLLSTIVDFNIVPVSVVALEVTVISLVPLNDTPFIFLAVVRLAAEPSMLVIPVSDWLALARFAFILVVPI